VKNYNFNGFDGIKGIIFDFDDTLYTQTNKEEHYINFTIKTVCDIMQIDRDAAIKLLERFDYFDISKRPRLNTVLKALGDDMEDKYNEYRIENFYMPDINTVRAVSNVDMMRLKSKYKLFLVTGEFAGNVQKKADAIGIDLGLFDCIRAGVIGQKKEKIVIYDEIMKEFGLEPNQVVAIGDRYVVDIEPLIKLGGGGIHIVDTNEVTEVINSAL
jgi:FMN phosphatase YigB (HAD superfamily)